MMEWLPTRRFEAELRQGLMVMDLSAASQTAAGCHDAWSNAVGFLNRIPPFVWQDYARRPPIQLPEPVPYTPQPAVAGNSDTGFQLPARAPTLATDVLHPRIVKVPEMSLSLVEAVLLRVFT